MSSKIETTLSDNGTHRLHVVFLVDTTASMGSYLEALKKALCQVNALLRVIFPSCADVSIMAYKDYGDGSDLLRCVWMGSYKGLSNFCNKLEPTGGGDIAEASKTALNALLKLVKTSTGSTTIVFHYTDAPPHHELTNPSGTNRNKETRALANAKPGYDWCRLSKRFCKLSHSVKIFTLVPEDSPAGRCGAAFYALLGELIVLNETTGNHITRVTMNLLLQLIGQSADNDTSFQRITFHEEKRVLEVLMHGDNDEDSFPQLNTPACQEPTFEPTVKNSELVSTEDVVFEVLPEIRQNLSRLRHIFKTDVKFRDTVFEAMADLVSPSNVMALTTNGVFGRLWRLICTRREDSRLDALVEKMGDCVASKVLTERERTMLKTWLEDSYDNAEEINAAIRAHDGMCSRFYVMDAFAGDAIPDADGLRSLARSPSPHALASVQNILSHMVLVVLEKDDSLPVDEDGNRLYLPETFGDYELFTMLPHLIRAGSQFTLKPAAILAILCCKNSSSLLEKRARRFLQSIRGKWLPPVDRIDRAEIISYKFSALMASSVAEALTEDERQFFDRLHKIWRYRRGRFNMFEVVTPLAPATPMLLTDSKEKCNRCGEWTSETLMDDNKKCGICLWMEESPLNKWARPCEGEKYFVKKTESYMVACSTCQALYAVLGPMDLNVPPKCHYCRGLDKTRRARLGAPHRLCMCCKSKWCYPANVANDGESKSFICPVCAHGGVTSENFSTVPTVSTTKHSVALTKIIEQNPMWVTMLGFRKKAASIIFSSIKLYQALVDQRDCLLLQPREGVEVPPLVYEGKAVLNGDVLIKTIKESIASASFVDTCQLCFEEFALEKLFLSCGHCSNRACKDCLTSWYQQNKPGKLFVPSHDMCPFCRQRPKYQILTQYNRDACGIVGLGRRKGALLRLRGDQYYGWCQDCWKVAYAMDRTCAEDGQVPSLTGFECEECQERSQLRRLAENAQKEEDQTALLLQESKACPGCSILTMHMGGCSHMKCAKCGIHWCYQCGTFKANSGQEVYEHMTEKHGGYGWIDDNDE